MKIWSHQPTAWCSWRPNPCEFLIIPTNSRLRTKKETYITLLGIQSIKNLCLTNPSTTSVFPTSHLSQKIPKISENFLNICCSNFSFSTFSLLSPNRALEIVTIEMFPKPCVFSMRCSLRTHMRWLWARTRNIELLNICHLAGREEAEANKKISKFWEKVFYTMDMQCDGDDVMWSSNHHRPDLMKFHSNKHLFALFLYW